MILNVGVGTSNEREEQEEEAEGIQQVIRNLDGTCKWL